MTNEKSTKVPVLQRSRRDWILTGVFTFIALVAIFLAWLTAPIRGVEFQATTDLVEPAATADFIPTQAQEIWTAEADFIQHRPVVFSSQVITTDGDTVIARDAQGEMTWSYERSDELCTVMSAWDNATLVYRSGRGCGEVVTFEGETPNYSATRAASASNAVVPLGNANYAGIAAFDRAELWRSDMVRTSEYGEVRAAHEQDQQPHPDCTIGSAMVSAEHYAITEECEGSYWLRILEPVPENSRNPEITAEVNLGNTPAHLIALSDSHVKVLTEEASPRMITYTIEGSEYQVADVAAVDNDLLWNDQAEVFYAPTADLGEFQTFFDGNRLYLFNPDNLEITAVLDDAIGTGTLVADRLLYPTAEGWRLFDWVAQVASEPILIDRADTSYAALDIIGTTVLELQNNEIRAYEISA